MHVTDATAVVYTVQPYFGSHHISPHDVFLTYAEARAFARMAADATRAPVIVCVIHKSDATIKSFLWVDPRPER
jgi:hypothetical protein